MVRLKWHIGTIKIYREYTAKLDYDSEEESDDDAYGFLNSETSVDISFSVDVKKLKTIINKILYV
eukprot:UN07499